MAENCKNCNEIISSNFCPNCGQKKYKRIDKKYISDEIQYTFIHMNKGFWYSIKNIIKNPGKTARDFIDGNRVNHYKPILLVSVLSGISAFISYKIIGLKEIISDFYSKQHMSSQLMNDYMSFTSSYNSIIMLLLIPCFGLITKLAFRKWGQNYYEHIVINAYILSFYTLISIAILYPIIYLLKDNADLVIPLTSMSMLTIPFILTWFFKGFYSDKSLKDIIERILLIILFTIVFFILCMIILMIGIVIFAIIKGPEAMEYIKPK